MCTYVASLAGVECARSGEGASAMVYTAFWASFSMPAMPVFSSVAFYLITLALIACGELSPLYEL